VPLNYGSVIIAASIVAAAVCTAFIDGSDAYTADQVSDREIYRQFSSKEAANKVLEFLRAKPFPQKQKESLLKNSRPEDRVELKRLLSTWKPEQFLLDTENGGLTISSVSGQILIEISQQVSDGQIIINEKPFQRPPKGSIFGAIRKHARSDQAGFRDLFFPKANAVSADTAAALPTYLYVEFASAGETPTESHTPEDEAAKSAQQLQEALMPDGSNVLMAYAKRYFTETKSNVTCNAASASGIVKLAGDLHRFESRSNGDVVILPPFEKGSAILLKPSRVDLGQASKVLTDLISQHQLDPSVESALQIVDGPVRLICQRLQLMKPNPRAASLCEKLYQRKVSIEGRCSRVDGEDKTRCLRGSGDRLPDRHMKVFEQDLLRFLSTESAEITAVGKSVASSQIIGRKMLLHQCLDGSACTKTYSPTVFEVVQPSAGEVPTRVKDLLGYRHASTGSAALVKYICEVQNETCAVLTNTDAALSLPKKDFENLRAKISQGNRGRAFKKTDFLDEASALRPLGQCCASPTCRTKLQSMTGGTVKFSDSERTAK
jgi:hypothetical protein